MVMASAREVEKIVLERLRHLSENRKLVEKIVKKTQDSTSDILPTLKKELSTQMGELRKAKEEAANLVSVLASEGTKNRQNRFIVNKLNDLEEKGEVIDKRIAQIKIDIERCQSRIVDANVVRENFRVFKDVFENLTPDENKELLQLLIIQVYYDQDHSKIKLSLRQLPAIGPLVNHKDGLFEPRKSWLPG